MSFFKNIREKIFGNYTPPAKKETEPIITITDDELICFYPSRDKTEKITWNNIINIEVLTTDEGPYVCDVFILIRDDKGGVAIPQEKKECEQVIDKIFKLPDFDFKLFTIAMGSTDNNRFTVWQKK